MAWEIDRVYSEALAAETPAWQGALHVATLVRGTDVAAQLFSSHPPDGRMDILPTLQPMDRTIFVTCAAPPLFLVRPGEWQPFPHSGGFKWGVLCESLALAEAGPAERLEWVARCASTTETEALVAWAGRDDAAVRWLRRVRLYIVQGDAAPVPAWQAACAVGPRGELVTAPALTVTILGACAEEYLRALPPLRVALERGLRALARVGLWVEAMLLCRNIELYRWDDAFVLREQGASPLIGAGDFVRDGDGALLWSHAARSHRSDPWEEMLARLLSA